VTAEDPRPRPVLRQCVACRCLVDRRLLWRVVRLAEGGLALDGGMGRSAYLCPSPSCLEEARRRKRLQRSLRCPVSDGVYAELQARIVTSGPATPQAR
jgi:predicted RNA-binding protein YlxR (DUF448 family)